MVWSIPNAIAALTDVYIAMPAMRLDAPQPCACHSTTTIAQIASVIAAHIAALIIRFFFMLIFVWQERCLKPPLDHFDCLLCCHSRAI